tara:strand:- start:3287 stop:3754 length:468 start_codon:yes stop_codon:yes gene_type:complete
MSEPIRTLAVKDLCTALSTVPDLKTIKRVQPRPIDLQVVPLPAAYIYDVLPETRARNGAWAIGKMEIAIVVFMDLTVMDASTGNLEFSDYVDVIQAKLHAALNSSTNTGNKVITELKELRAERVVSSETYGELNLTIEVTYQHKRGDAFTTDISK